MKRITLAFFVLMVISVGASAQNYSFKKYRHAPFQHLEFDILDKWQPVQNGLEVVFTDEENNLPQLFFQTIEKTKYFNDSISFLAFLTTQKPLNDYQNVKSIQAGAFQGMSYEYVESNSTNLYEHGLIIDVGEGIVFFYLKTETKDKYINEYKSSLHPIIERLRASFDFR